MMVHAKRYSAIAAGIAAFLGGIGAGIVVLGLNQRKSGNMMRGNLIMALGIFLALIQIFLLNILPDEILFSKIILLMPFLSTAIIYLAAYRIEKTQADVSSATIEFEPLWKPVLIGLAFIFITLITTFFITNPYSEDHVNEDDVSYDALILQIIHNDSVVMLTYDEIVDLGNAYALDYIKNTTIPTIDKLDQLISALASVEDAPPNRDAVVDFLRERNGYRRKEFELLMKSINEQTFEYEDEILELREKCDSMAASILH